MREKNSLTKFVEQFLIFWFALSGISLIIWLALLIIWGIIEIIKYLFL